MNDNGQTGYFLLVSVVVSLLIHALLWQVASHMEVPLFTPAKAIDRPSQQVTVRSIDLDELVKPPLLPRTESKKRILDQQEERLHKLFEQEKLVDQVKPELKPQLTGLGRDLLKKVVAIPKKKSNESIGTAPMSSPPPEILSIRARELPPTRAMSERQIIPEIERKLLTESVVPSITSTSPGGTGLGQPEAVELGMRLKLPARRPTELPPLPVVKRPELPKSITQTKPELISPEANVLDSLMQVDVAVYWDEQTADGYVEITIMPNEKADRLVTIPKDVLFLVDSSASIGWEKLREFRNGLDQAFDYLQPEDRFDVVAFREEPRPLFDRLRPVTPESVEAAREFLKQLKSRGKTDVYAGLAPYIAIERTDESRPYLIFMLSDGLTTTGHKLANNAFIRRVSSENRANASIFSFSAGKEANMFLMNFLSYRNRGLSVHAEKLDNTVTQLTGYVGGLTDIIVADPRCQVTGEVQEDIYPRQLQHLFRGHPLTVYGRVPKGTETLGIQVIGLNREGKEEELVVTADLSEAGTAKGELATRWAAQKIYHLIAEWTVRNDAATRQEIERLAKQYSIVVPYLEEDSQ